MSNPVTDTKDQDAQGVPDNPSPADGVPGNPYAAPNTWGARRRNARLAAAVAAAEKPRQRVPRDGRWWAGAALLTVSALLLAFVSHTAVFSAAQHNRAQALAYDELRTTLAKAETPVGQLDLNGELVEQRTPVALLEIPVLGVSEVVAEGSTSRVLRSGPGHRRDSVLPGQAGTSVILGRQLTYGGPFGGLDRLAPGDEIRVTTGQAEHTFQVFGLRRAGDPLPEPLGDGEGRLELMTADGLELFPSGVLHVDAQLVSEVQPTPTKVLAEPALPDEEREMSGDDGAWFTAFFVLVFFVAAGVALWWLWTSWGRWHAWLIGVPVLLALGVTCADIVMDALPNLL